MYPHSWCSKFSSRKCLWTKITWIKFWVLFTFVFIYLDCPLNWNADVQIEKSRREKVDLGIARKTFESSKFWKRLSGQTDVWKMEIKILIYWQLLHIIFGLFRIIFPFDIVYIYSVYGHKLDFGEIVFEAWAINPGKVSPALAENRSTYTRRMVTNKHSHVQTHLADHCCGLYWPNNRKVSTSHVVRRGKRGESGATEKKKWKNKQNERNEKKRLQIWPRACRGHLTAVPAHVVHTLRALRNTFSCPTL